MSVSHVWLQLLDGSLVRADQITEITVHQTPEIAGKPARWLLDAVVATPVGSGDPAGWRSGPLHRTLAQMDTAPHEAPAVLARLLAQLDAVDAAGIVRADTSHLGTGPHPGHTIAAGNVRFGFTAFPGLGSTPGSSNRSIGGQDDSTVQLERTPGSANHPGPQ